MVVDPVEHIFHDVEDEDGGRIEHGTILRDALIIEEGGEVWILGFEEIASDDEDAGAGDAEIFLSRGEDEAMGFDVDGAAVDIAAHISDERKGGGRGFLELGAQEAIICAIVDVARIFAILDLVILWDMLEVIAGAVVGVVDVGVVDGVAHGISRPEAGMDTIDGIAGARKGHRNLAKLERSAALHEEDGEVVRDIADAPKLRFEVVHELVEEVGAVANFADTGAHTDVPEIILSFFYD